MDIYLILLGAVLAAVVGVGIYAFWLHRQMREFKNKFKLFFGTKKNPHLSTIVMKNTDALERAGADIKALQQTTAGIQELAVRSLQKVGTYFYNPYGDTGGTFSFSIAFLNYANNGVVISSLHTREGTRVYAKEIANGKSKQYLTEEEMEALRRADLEV
jgi:hypothetical protein